MSQLSIDQHVERIQSLLVTYREALNHYNKAPTAGNLFLLKLKNSDYQQALYEAIQQHDTRIRHRLFGFSEEQLRIAKRFRELNGVAIRTLFLFDTEGHKPGWTTKPCKGNNQIRLDIGYQKAPVKVNWGDGNVQIISHATVHTYSKPGQYVVSVEGHIERFVGTRQVLQNPLHRFTMIDVMQWGDTLTVGDWENFLAFRESLEAFSAIDAPYLKKSKNTKTAFQHVPNFKGFTAHWNHH